MVTAMWAFTRWTTVRPSNLLVVVGVSVGLSAWVRPAFTAWFAVTGVVVWAASQSLDAEHASFAVENLIAAAGPRLQPHHYRSETGDEVDLVLVRGGRPVVVVEVRRSTFPTPSSGTRRAFRDRGAESAYEWALGPFTPTTSMRAQP